MTEHINLQTVDAYLASIILPQGNMMPSPLVVMSDDTPLYDEQGVIHEMESAMAEGRPAKIDAEIINIEVYSPTLITVTFSAVDLDKTYRINVPRQLMQVGYLYNRLLQAPACALISESEAQMNKDFNHNNVQGECLPPFDSEDIMVRMSFPKDMSQETRLSYNYVLNNLHTDHTEGISKDELREIAPKIRLVVDTDESRALRVTTIDLLLGLVEGNEDHVVKLYEFAQHVDSAKETLDRNALLSSEEREALLVFDYIISTVNYIHPDQLIAQLQDIEDAINSRPNKKSPSTDEDEIAVDMDDLFSEDFKSSLNDIITEFHQENPESVTINKNSTFEERVDYVSLPSNLVPLMGGLLKLSDKINVELYYSRDWNISTVSEDEYGSRGELFMALTMLTVQRLQMFGKSIDLPDTMQDIKTLALSLSSEALTKQSDIEMWYLKESLYRAAAGDKDPLLQFLIMSITETPIDQQIHGPFGQILHWLGHIMVDEDHTREDMVKLFAKLPLMQEFVETLYDDADNIEDEDSEDEDDSEYDVDAEVEECYVSNACNTLPYVEAEPNVDLATEAAEALVIFASHCFESDDPSVEPGTPEWVQGVGIYLNRVLTDEQ